MLILPETPRYLIKKGNGAGAAKSLSRLRRLDVDHPALIEELSEIQANHEYEMSIGTSSYLSLFKPPIRKRLFTGMGLQALQQLTGVCSPPSTRDHPHSTALTHFGPRQLPTSPVSPSPFQHTHRHTIPSLHRLASHANISTGQLHLLLWHILLPKLRHLQPLHHLRHHLRRQHLIHRPRSLPR